MANAKLAWTSETGNIQTYTLPVNFNRDYQELLQDDSDRQRALDGTLRSYRRTLKARLVLTFTRISSVQKEQLAGIKQSQSEIDFYRDAAQAKTFTGVWVNDLNFRESAP